MNQYKTNQYKINQTSERTYKLVFNDTQLSGQYHIHILGIFILLFKLIIITDFSHFLILSGTYFIYL